MRLPEVRILKLNPIIRSSADREKPLKNPKMIPTHLLQRALAAAAIVSGAHATVNVQAYWKMDDTTVGILPTDSVNDWDFTGRWSATGTTPATASPAPGSTAYTTFAAAGFWEPKNPGGTAIPVVADNYGFEMWFRVPAPSLGNTATLITLGNVDGSPCLVLNDGGTGLHASLRNQSYVGDAKPVSAGVWHHTAWVTTDGTTHIYLDGQEVASTTNVGTPSPVIHLGINPGGGRLFTGDIDEVRYFTFASGQFTAKDLLYVPSRFRDEGATATFGAANLSTDQVSEFRLGGAIQDFVTVSETDGLSVVAGTAPKHLISISQEGPLATGTYPLISYEGTLGGLGFGGLALAPLSGRISATLVNNTTDSTIDFQVTGAASGVTTWTATGGSTWDVGLSSNWKFNVGGAATQFFSGDSVTFNDSAPDTAVTLSGTITPYDVTIENPTKNYTFAGAGIGGSAIVYKSGAGTVTFNNPNTYSGGTQIDEGVVIVGTGGGLGTGAVMNEGSVIFDHTGEVVIPGGLSGSGAFEKKGTGALTLGGNSSYAGILLTAGTIKSGNPNSLGDTSQPMNVAAGTALDVNGFGFGSKPLVVQGSGIAGEGVVTNSGPGQESAVTSLTLAGDATIGGTGRWDVRGAGSILDGNFKLTKTGTNHVSVVNTTVTLKDIDADGGRLTFEYGTNMDDSRPGVITVHSGGSLGFGDYGNPITCTKPIVLAGGLLATTSGDGNGNAVVASPVTLSTGSNPVGPWNGSTLTLSGTVSGPGSLSKTDTGTLALLAAPTYTGDTEVVSGTLSLAIAGLSDSSTVRLGAAATLSLGFAGNDTVNALYIDGVQQPVGVYTSAHASGRFAGSGGLNVLTGPSANAYTDWETANGITGAGSTVDSDGDGLANGIEFVVGGDPSGPNSDSNALRPVVSSDATTLKVVFRRTAASAGYAPKVEYGSDLSGWTAAVNGTAGVAITTDADFFGAGIDRVTVNIPRSGAKMFARLRVDIP